MHILYVSHRFPYPPTHGGKIRAFNTIQHLARNHRVTVVSSAFSGSEAEEGRALASHCANVEMEIVSRPMQVARMIARLPTSIPSTMGYFYSGGLKRRIDSILSREKIDLIIVHCSSVAPYVADVEGLPKILDFVDMDSQKWLEYARFKPFPLSVGYRLEGLKLERAEKQLARKFDICTVTTPAEQQTLDGYGLDTRTAWFPNGVDTEFFQPSESPYDPDTISFVGRMNYYPNEECMVEFCAQTLPRLREQWPGLKLLIVGADPTPPVLRLARIPGVVVTGSVPDVRPFVQQSALMVAPLNIARGTQNKILEAMAMGVPVVASRVAAGGVDAIANDHLSVASDADQLTRGILAIVRDPKERRRLSVEGRARIIARHEWSQAMARLDAIIDEVVVRAKRNAHLPLHLNAVAR